MKGRGKQAGSNWKNLRRKSRQTYFSPDAIFSVGLNGESEAFKLAVVSRRVGLQKLSNWRRA
jgi:hypothetical protein